MLPLKALCYWSEKYWKTKFISRNNYVLRSQEGLHSIRKVNSICIPPVVLISLSMMYVMLMRFSNLLRKSSNLNFIYSNMPAIKSVTVCGLMTCTCGIDYPQCICAEEHRYLQVVKTSNAAPLSCYLPKQFGSYFF